MAKFNKKLVENPAQPEKEGKMTNFSQNVVQNAGKPQIEGVKIMAGLDKKVSRKATKLQKETNMSVESREYSSKVVLKGLDEVASAYSQLLPEGKKFVNKVVRRIKKSGFNHPILIFKNGVIMAGNFRYFAAVKSGLDKIPTLCWNDLSIDELNSYVEASCDFAFDSNLFQEIHLVPVYSNGTVQRHSYLIEELDRFFERPNPPFQP